MEYVDDGSFDWSLGQDAWHNPDRIQNGQYASGINISTRGGVLQPRDAFIDCGMHFEAQQIHTPVGDRFIADVWLNGKFQALIPYSVGDDYLLTVISGHIFITSVKTMMTRLLSADLRVNQYRPRVNWTHASDKIVIFDYPDYPLIVDNLVVTRSDILHTVNGLPAPQVPISTIGTYNQNRLFIAGDGIDFTAGDPVGVVEGPITFTEIFLPSSNYVNQQFTLPDGDSLYPITAMGFLQVLDTSTGLGPMFIATQKKIYSYRTDQPRAQWGQGPFGTVMLANTGIMGPRAFINVNSDLMFMSDEGHIHTLSSAGSDQKKWGNVPISREVHNWIRNRDHLNMYTVMGYFDNRILISVNPFRTPVKDLSFKPVSDYAFGGFVVLEIESMASFLSQGTPTWVGLWTGVHPMEIQIIGDRCFVMAKDGGNRLYEIDNEQHADFAHGRKRLIRSRVYTKEYFFEKPSQNKRDSTVTVHMRDLYGQVQMDIAKKPSHALNWLKYAAWIYKAGTCPPGPRDSLINGTEPHQIKQLIFGNALEEGCSPVNQEEYEQYRSIQFRITITGEHWRLEALKVRASLMPQQEYHDIWTCDLNEPVYVSSDCDDDWVIP